MGQNQETTKTSDPASKAHSSRQNMSPIILFLLENKHPDKNAEGFMLGQQIGCQYINSGVHVQRQHLYADRLLQKRDSDESKSILHHFRHYNKKTAGDELDGRSPQRKSQTDGAQEKSNLIQETDKSKQPFGRRTDIT